MRMLVPTDFSPRCRAALKWACQRGATHIDVLHVVPAPSAVRVALDAYLGLPMPTVPEDVRGEALRMLDLFVRSIVPGCSVDQLVEPGDPAATIVRMAAELESDLIVMGTRAHLLASVAHQVVTCAPCPVLLLRGDEATSSAHEHTR